MPVSPQTARREPAQCHLRPLRSPSSRSEHFEGSRGGRLRSRRHALHRQISHSRISYPIHHSGGRERTGPSELARLSPDTLLVACFGLRIRLQTPDSGMVWETGELAGDLFAAWLVIPADLPYPGVDLRADVRAPCADVLGGCRYRQGLNLEMLLRVPLQ